MYSNLHSPDLNQNRLSTLKNLFPDLFNQEGQLNPQALAQLINPEQSSKERYEFNWIGKNNSKKLAFSPSPASLVYDPARSHQPDADIIHHIIEGENLDSLKCLLHGYREAVKCIYIDPPYNTGKDFIYKDKYGQTISDYLAEQGIIQQDGIRLHSNPETDGRRHSNWLSMMYSRLLLSRELLKSDGFIFISIDDNEVHNLRKICDEVFGEENFVVNSIWEKVKIRKNSAKWFSTAHDHVLIYCKNKEFCKRNLLARENVDSYKNPDNDPRGVWIPIPVHANNKYDANYTITKPNGVVLERPKNNYWRFSEDSFNECVKDNRVHWGEGDGYPTIKRFLSEVQDGLVPKSIFYFDEVGGNPNGNADLQKLFQNIKIFDNPKSVKLIQTLISIATNSNSNDIILDFFAGSGTTGQAVIELNKEDGGNRRCILIQIPEQIEKSANAYNADFKKISDITIARNRKVLERIAAETVQEESEAAEKPELFENENPANLSQGFKVWRMSKSSFYRANLVLDPKDSEEERRAKIEAFLAEEEQVLDMRLNIQEIENEILLKMGLALDYELGEPQKWGSNELKYAKDQQGMELYYCLDEHISTELITQLSTQPNKRFACLHKSLTTSQKWNLEEALGSSLHIF